MCVCVTGILAVGFTDGGVELQQYECDADATSDLALCRDTLVVVRDKDYMPVSSLAWTTCQQVKRDVDTGCHGDGLNTISRVAVDVV